MITSRFAAISCCVATVLACTADSSIPVGSVGTGPEFATITASPIRPSASGSGIGNLGLGGTFRVFTFSARITAAGSASGQFQITNTEFDPVAWVGGPVLCLTIIGNAAWIGALIQHSSDPTRFGEVGFRVEDLGEGSSAPADRISLAFVNEPTGFATEYCATTPASPSLMNIESGNIQVR